MAKIICVTSGLTGILNASFELVARLKTQGHEVVYASPINVEQRVLAQGINFIALPEINPHPGADLPSFSSPFKKTKRLLFKIKNASTRRKKALDNTFPHAFVQLLDEHSSDLVIIDVELHEYIFCAYAKGTPLLLLSQWFTLWKRPGLPYLLHDTIPGKGIKGKRLMIELSWWVIRLQRWWTFTKQKYYSVFTNRRTILLDLAKKVGFPKAFIRENNWPGPFTYGQLPVISMTAEELEFPHSPRPNLFYIGPMVYENRVDPVVSKKTPYSIEDVFTLQDQKKAALLYCSVSTLHKGDQLFIKNLIAAVKDKKDWLLIIGMGGLIDTSIFGQLPANIFAFERVPQLKVLEKAHCSINHGGIHTINECIHYKVPMLIYSGKRSDQNGCAARIAYHKLGIMADKDVDDSVAIQANIHEILNNSSFAKRMNEIHKRYEAYKKEARLESVVDRILNKQG